MFAMSVTLDTSHLEMSALKAFALSNIDCMLVTLDTSHLEMSALKDCALENIWFMSVTLDTFHSAIGPSALGQLPTDETCKYVSTAALSSVLVFGAGCTYKLGVQGNV